MTRISDYIILFLSLAIGNIVSWVVEPIIADMTNLNVKITTFIVVLSISLLAYWLLSKLASKLKGGSGNGDK